MGRDLAGERWVRPGPSLPQQTPLLQAFEDTSSSYPFALPPCPGNAPAGFFGPEAQRNLECCQARGPPGGPWSPSQTYCLPLCPQPLSGDDLIMDSGASSWGCQQGPRSQSAPCPLISLLSLPHCLPKTLLTLPQNRHVLPSLCLKPRLMGAAAFPPPQSLEWGLGVVLPLNSPRSTART